MKKIIFGLFAVALLSLGTIWVAAQNSGGGDGAHGFGSGKDGRSGQMFERMFDRIADELKLSVEQRAQAQQVIADSKTRIQPLIEQLRQNHEAIENLGRDGAFDEARVNEIAGRQAETTKQMIVEKERAKAALFALLTPEQRAQATELQEKFKTRMHKRGFGGGMPPSEF